MLDNLSCLFNYIWLPSSFVSNAFLSLEVFLLLINRSCKPNVATNNKWCNCTYLLSHPSPKLNKTN